MKYCFLSILAGGFEIPPRLNSKAPNISHTQRCRALSLRYILVNAEGKNPDEDNDDQEEKINFVIEDVNQVENKQPGETKLIKSKTRSKASVIDDDGTWWKWKYQYKNEEKQAVDDKTLEKDQEMLDIKLLSWNSKYHVLENKTTTAMYLIHI